jgi:hypothetical protein
MKILEVKTRETADTITMYATCKIRRIGYDEVYFTFDKKYQSFLQIDASPFAAALLIPSMKQGEDLIVEGSMSQELYEGMHRIMDIFLSWNIGLKPIRIVAKNLTSDTARPKATASFFSGGVDSFYTFLKHKRNPTDPVTHLLLVNGYDIDPRNKKLWLQTRDTLREVAKVERVNLVEVESNVRSLVDPILAWDYAHGGCLAAVGLCLRKGLKQVYVPSSCTAEAQIHWGTHMDVDKHWSTEKIKFTHDGTEASRVNKVSWEIAKSPTALRYLRVCYMNEVGAFNCGACEKCLRTMINLHIAGVLSDAETFPHEIDVDKVANIAINDHIDHLYKENLEALEERGELPKLQEAIRNGLATMQPVSISTLERIRIFLIYLDHVYLRGYLFRLAQDAIGRKFQ